jgi:hypothetical protein
MEEEILEEEILDTSGFYKLDGDVLLFGPNFVLNANYELRREIHDQYTYPTDGWYWFNSKEEASAFFSGNSSSAESSGVIGFFKSLFGG